MKLNLYSVVDKTAGRSILFFAQSNDGMAIRQNVVQLSKELPLGDLQICRIGTVDDETLQVDGCVPVNVAWDAYKFPENPLKPREGDTKNEKSN